MPMLYCGRNCRFRQDVCTGFCYPLGTSALTLSGPVGPHGDQRVALIGATCCFWRPGRGEAVTCSCPKSEIKCPFFWQILRGRSFHFFALCQDRLWCFCNFSATGSLVFYELSRFLPDER